MHAPIDIIEEYDQESLAGEGYAFVIRISDWKTLSKYIKYLETQLARYNAATGTTNKRIIGHIVSKDD